MSALAALFCLSIGTALGFALRGWLTEAERNTRAALDLNPRHGDAR